MTGSAGSLRIASACLGAVLLLAGCQSSLVPADSQPSTIVDPAPAPAPVPAPAVQADVPPPPPAWKNPPSRYEVQQRRTEAARQQLPYDQVPQPEIQVARIPASDTGLAITGGGVTRVAVLLPMSGRHARLGGAMRNAAQLALFEFADKSFELMFLDTGGTAAGAREAAVTAVSDGAALIIGPLLSTSTRAAGEVAQQYGIPVVSFSSDSAAAGPGVYILGFRPETEVRRVVEFAYNAGLRRFAVLAPSNTFGDRIVTEFRRVVADLGAVLSREARYFPDGGGYDDVIRELADYGVRHAALERQKQELQGRTDEVSQRALARLETLQTIGDPDFDALLVADGGRRLKELAALLPYYDIDPKVVKMLGTGQWDEPGIGVEPALLGGWFAASDPGPRAPLMAKYQETFGDVPPRLITLAYDATALAAVLVRGANSPDYSAPNLTQSTGFLGTDGVFRLNPGGLGERALAVLEVRERDSVVLDPAPRSFQVPTN